ncbi:formyltransferase family protein [Thermodesulfobacteriota bacterium]
MRVLALTNKGNPIIDIIAKTGCRVKSTENKIDPKFVRNNGFEFIVSYRYRHIISPEVIREIDGKVINLHISLLPWNRGADPNLWSWLEKSPKGVTIHYVDEGIDTGDIISQLEIKFNESIETLKSSYEKLNEEILTLFKKQWPIIIKGKANRQRQITRGTFHRLKDKECYLQLFEKNGWDTPVSSLIGKTL